jgi:hypothetical protein
VRFLLRLNQTMLLNLCTAGMLLWLSMPASAAVQMIEEAYVTAVRAYADGNVLIFLSVTAVCFGRGRNDTFESTVLGVHGPGTDRVYTAALAALLGTKKVEIEYDDVRVGQYCPLVDLRIK